MLFFNNYKDLFQKEIDVLFVSLPNYLASEATIKGRWLPKFCKYGWLEKVKHGHYKVSDEMMVMLNDPTVTGM